MPELFDRNVMLLLPAPGSKADLHQHPDYDTQSESAKRQECIFVRAAHGIPPV
jgi:hypothetical protein